MTLLLPEPGAVHIWYVPLQQPESIIKWLERSLSSDEWARLRRFHFADDGRRYVVRRAGLRHLLAAYLHRSPAEIAFTYGRQQKPALAHPLSQTNLHFNLSDSGEMAIYAFAVDQEIGVDIEAHRDYPDARQVAKRFFSPTEYTWLCQQPQQTESIAFLRCWTCKEAVVKALGDGLMAPLQDFTVAHWQSPPSLIWPTAPPTEWTIHLLTPPPGYSAALAVPGATTAIHEQPFRFES